MNGFYYKFEDGGLLQTKSRLDEPLEEGCEEITREEYISLLNAKEQGFVPPRPTEKENRINELKSLLASTDYQAIKYAEGWLSEQEYAPIKSQRQAWREEINELENE